MAKIDNLPDDERGEAGEVYEIRKKLHETLVGQLEAAWKLADAYADFLSAVGVAPLLNSVLPSVAPLDSRIQIPSLTLPH